MDALSIIQLRAPQWSTDPRISGLIVYARNATSEAFFEDNTEKAVALRVLHLLALEAGRNGNPGTGTDSGTGHGGQITSETEGSLSKSFASMSTSNVNAKWGDLGMTIYGQELISLIRGSGMSAMTRQGDPNDVLFANQSLWNPFA